MNRVYLIFGSVFLLGMVFLFGVMFLFGIPAQAKDKKPKILYPKETQLDFEGADIEGNVRNPGEFYFKNRPQERFDSLVKRRKNFHREMLRDVVRAR